MKKHLLFLVSSLLILCMGCNTSVQKVSGDYSYKQSGLVNLTDNDGHQTSTFITKQGQMNILQDRHGDQGDIIVTFNEMGGGTYSCTGSIKGDSIILDNHEFYTRFSNADTVVNFIQLGKTYSVQSTGRGIISDDMILMDEVWSGNSSDGSPVQLHADKITLLAEEN
ncbi:MAG: hypothetical protein K6A41_01970 [Bacteroidales bacterium]|nr:hypothetical protein [Bacteroidales bacterium]